jgi:putative DNA primase/helicase
VEKNCSGLSPQLSLGCINSLRQLAIPLLQLPKNDDKRTNRIKRKATLKIGIIALDAILKQIKEIHFPASQSGKIPLKTYYVKSIENVLAITRKQGFDFAVKNGTPYFFNGEYWQRFEPDVHRRVLQAAGIRQGIPHTTAADYSFIDKQEKQFASEARFPLTTATDTSTINLRNGTVHFGMRGVELLPFNRLDGLRYRLDFDYDPTATATLFKKFFDRVQPDTGVQKLLFQYIAYVFLRKLKLEMMLFLYGEGDNGKSVFMDIIMALVGREQLCSFPLEGITSCEYQRAALGDYVLNICTEIPPRMKPDTFKKSHRVSRCMQDPSMASPSQCLNMRRAYSH